MKSKVKILVATGGTGGHVFPAYSIVRYFKKKQYSLSIITDKRGLKYLENYQDLKLKVINSDTIYNKNPLNIILSFFIIIFAFINSAIYLIKLKPKIVFGMGGYSSFPVCLAAKLLKIPFIIYENNLCLGKANKYLLPFAHKLLVSYQDLEGVKDKYKLKIVKVGNIIREEILNYNEKISKRSFKNMGVLILGGSQAAKLFAEKIPVIIKACKEEDIKLRIYQQCLSSQQDDLKNFYNSLNIDHEIFSFKHDLLEYFMKVDFVITRAGSSMMAELLNCNVPIIAIPLPSSADNHQFKNAKYFQDKGYAYMIEQKNIDTNLYPLIKSIHNNNTLLTKIKINQNRYSDKKVFEKIDIQIKDIINEQY